jgi:hypothetical protein
MSSNSESAATANAINGGAINSFLFVYKEDRRRI